MPQKISEYAVIGDCETAALVGRNGSIDWLCWPRFDSGACFAALLGTHDHGHWQIRPAGEIIRTTRRYRGETLILETDFETAEGVVTIIDYMPIRRERIVSDLVRIVVGRSGRVPMTMEMKIRFDYGRIVPWVQRLPNSAVLRAVAGPHTVLLDAPVEFEGQDTATVSTFTVEAGQRIPFRFAYCASHQEMPSLVDAEDALQATEEYWREWASGCNYSGRWREAVVRSLVTTKAMTYRPTGGTVAAVTTSLPERIGGQRNWDYRFCWLRDATFALLSLINAGYPKEAEAWSNWLLRAVAGSADQMQPIYGIAGEHRSDEIIIEGLPGYRNSRPVRIGNDAYRQLQIDNFGSVMDTLYHAQATGLPLKEASTNLQIELVEYLEKVWQQPDSGIWEVRGSKQHFVHSKLMAWVAFDRAVKACEQFDLAGPVERWRDTRERVRTEILEKGFDRDRGAFVQAFGSTSLDAATLLIPIMGFLPADDARVVGTTRAIEKELMHDGLVRRYDTGTGVDGLPGDEGIFLACSFWLVDNYSLQGRTREAETLFERLLSLRNDVGLLSEQYDPARGELIGNFPQAFSHFALMNTAYTLAGAQGGR